MKDNLKKAIANMICFFAVVAVAVAIAIAIIYVHQHFMLGII